MIEKNQTSIDKKQIIVAVIILLFAILLITYSFKTPTEETKATASTAETTVPEKMKHAVFNITANTEKDCLFQIYYTTKDGEEFSEENSVKYQGKKGEHTYQIDLPIEKAMHVRIDFSQGRGMIMVKDMYISGTQEAKIDDIAYYDMYQFSKIGFKENNILSFETIDDSAYLNYTKPLIEIETENLETEQAEGVITEETIKATPETSEEATDTTMPEEETISEEASVITEESVTTEEPTPSEESVSETPAEPTATETATEDNKE